MNVPALLATWETTAKRTVHRDSMGMAADRDARVKTMAPATDPTANAPVRQAGKVLPARSRVQRGTTAPCAARSAPAATTPPAITSTGRAPVTTVGWETLAIFHAILVTMAKTAWKCVRIVPNLNATKQTDGALRQNATRGILEMLANMSVCARTEAFATPTTELVTVQMASKANTAISVRKMLSDFSPFHYRIYSEG